MITNATGHCAVFAALNAAASDVITHFHRRHHPA
jgi:hypothetical protein